MSKLTLNTNSVRAGIATVGVIGGFVSGYGVLVPFYIDKYVLDIEIGGRLFALTGFSGLVGVFITSYLIDKVKGAIAGSLGTFLTGLGILILAFANSWNTILIGVFLIGTGFGAGQVGVSQLVVDIGGIEAARRTNKNNIAFALSSIVVPIVFGLLLVKNYTILMLVFAVASFLTSVVFYTNTRGTLVHKPEHEHKKANHNVSIALLLLGISTYVGLESAATGWIPTYLLDKGLTTSESSLGLSLFFVVLLAVRLIILKFIHNINFGLLVVLSTALLIPALYLLFATNLYYLAIILLAMFCAPVFPMAFAWVVKISPGNARITGFIFFSSISGSMIFPYLIGNYMNSLGTSFAPLLMMIPAIFALIFFTLGYRSISRF